MRNIVFVSWLLVFGGAVMGALFTAAILWPAEPIKQETIKKSEQPKESKQGESSPEVATHPGFFNRHEKTVAGISAIVVALFTIVLGVSTIKLYQVTNKSAVAAEGASKMAEKQVWAMRNSIKAWIYAGPTSPFPQPDGQGNTHIGINIVNYGQSIGLVTKLCIDSSDALPPSTPEEYVFKNDPALHSYPMGQGEQWRGNNFVIPANHRFIFGYVEYLDVFERTYVARFCGMNDRGVYKPSGTPTWNHPGKKKPA